MIQHLRIVLSTAGLACLYLAPSVSAQQGSSLTVSVAAQPATADANDSSEGAGASSAVVTTPAAPAPRPLTARWLDLKTLTHSQRYRNIYNQGGSHTVEEGQQRSLIQGRFKIDSEDRYAIGFRASSGRYFNWSYGGYAGTGKTRREITGGGFLGSFTLPQLLEVFAALPLDPQGAAELTVVTPESAGWQFYMRELYLSATPVKPVTIEFGSLGIERGLASEATTFDEDGYLTGERIRIHDAKHVFFDQIGYTNAFFGDVADVNLFHHGSSYGQFNYRQIFLNKQLNKRASFSADYTWQEKTSTFRQAVSIGTPEVKVVDKVRLETYERTNTVNLQGLDVHGASGFAVFGEKSFGKRFHMDAGFASIDKDYSVYHGSRLFHSIGYSLNGDSYAMGKRPFTHASFQINPVVTAFGFYTHAVGAKVLNLDQQGLNAGLTFDFKALANLEKKIF